MVAPAHSKAFAVWFKDLDRWDPVSFRQIVWKWPKHMMQPIGSFLRPRKEKVDRATYRFEDLQPITIHFDGSIDKRHVDANREYTMDLFFARPGNVVVAKIDLKNGAVGLVPDWANVVVTGHFAVYEPDRGKVLPEYFHRVIQTSFFKEHLWRNKVGAEGRKEVKLDFFEAQAIPLPPLPTQKAIVAHWRQAQEAVSDAVSRLQKQTEDLDVYLQGMSDVRVFKRPWIALDWRDIQSWDMKAARAAYFRLCNPSFKPMAIFAEEATELVKPWEDPEKEWPVYGVNNKEGVFFRHYQKGKDFNAPYKRIRKDWFFHNPTRSSVGSLGIVPEVPEDAITSPEYQVWRIRSGLLPGYVAVLIGTQFFIDLIQAHRVGAVKQRLYVDNLLQIPIPVVSEEMQREVAVKRESLLSELAKAKKYAEIVKEEVEAMILGAKSVR